MSTDNSAPQTETDSIIRVCICGAGAMGTLFGTTLIKGGQDVLFLEGWVDLLNELKERKTAVRIVDGKEEEIPVKVIPIDECPSNPFDLVIIAVKSSATRETLEKIAKKAIGPQTVVLTLQGGFDNPDIIAEYMEDPKLLLFGKTACSCTPAGKMKITNFGIASTTVWPLGTKMDEEPSERVKTVVGAVNKSGLPFDLTNMAIPDRWKMLLYYPTNIAVSALVQLPFKLAWEDPKCQDVLINLAKECAQVAKLEGVDEQYFNEEIAIEAVRKLAIEECPNHPGSMLTDRHNKRITECEATNGAELKLAEKHGIDLPYTRTIYGLVHAIESNYGNEFKFQD